MAESTLRAYLKEIDDLIEHEQLDEAIAHCRYILQTYPKHLDTYRLLGKGYLEAKRYGDAADIFQRVLSAVPDDFVAHVGMSIVREDEGNTEVAIWHMERAFETNPANPAIQQELRRLIGRRDGIEPHKVRLTRGALARMYSHGELYAQAVAELRAALQEDTERADLQVVLAEMYWRTGQRAEAVDLCNRILEKLPYCREANRILAAAYQAGGRTDEAAVYHRRLATLDPYAAYIETAMVDPQTVDAGSVRLERLAWQPGQALPQGQPEWASSLGVDLRGERAQRAGQGEQPPPTPPASGPVPSWLKSVESEKAVASPPSEAVVPMEQPSSGAFVAPIEGGEEHIPNWMREAGWKESSGEAVETPVSFTDEDLVSLEDGAPAGEGELAPGEIPEWLQAVAPKGIAAEAPPPIEPTEPETPPEALEEGTLPPWLGDLTPGETPTARAPQLPPEAEGLAEFPLEPRPALPPEFAGLDAEQEVETGEAGGRAVPSWLEQSSPGATDTIISWLGDRPGREPASSKESIPDWIQEAGPADLGTPPAEIEAEEAFPAAEPLEAAPAEPEPKEMFPAWLSGVANAAAQQEPLRSEELPWLQGRAATGEPAAEGEDWLAGLGEPEAAPPPAPREAPDWLTGIAEPELAGPSQPAAPEQPPSWLRETGEPVGRKSLGGPEAPDWLRGLGEAETPAEPELRPAGEAPGWLKAIAEPLAPEPAAPRGPDWLRDVLEPEAAEPQAPAEPEPIAAEEETDWLRAITEEEPSSVTEAPEWAEAAEASEGVPAGEAAPPTEPPDWLREFEEAPATERAGLPPVFAESEPAQGPELGGALDWLQESAREVAPEPYEQAMPAEPWPVPEAATMGEDDVFKWLEGLAARQGAGEPEPSAMPEERGAEAAVGVPGAPAAAILEDRVLPEEPAEGLEWLERLAAERGIEAEVRPAAAGSALPEAELQAPEWLREPSEAQPLPEETAAAPTPLAPAVPEWPEVEEGPRAEGAAVQPSLPPKPVSGTEPFPEVPEWLQAAATQPAPVKPEPPPTIEPVEPKIPAVPGEPAYIRYGEPVTAELGVPEWLRPTEGPAPTGFETVPVTKSEPAVQPPETGVLPPLRVQMPATSELEMPDWLRATEQAASVGPEALLPVKPPLAPPSPPVEPPIPRPTAAAEPPIAFPSPAAEEPSWLKPGEEALRAMEAELEEAVPDWLRAQAAPPAAATLPAEVAPAPPTPAVAAIPPTELPSAPPIPVVLHAAMPPMPATIPSAAPPVARPAPAAQAPEPIALPAPPAPPIEPPSAGQPPQPIVVPPAEAPALPPPVALQRAAPPPAEAPALPPPVALQRAAPPPAEAPAPPPPVPPAVEALPSPGPAPAKPKPAVIGPSEILDNARQSFASGDIETALKHYSSLIRRKREVQVVIEDLRAALAFGTTHPAVWQTLGDAYMKADRLPEAIEAYRHGLEAS
jgi:tetratricopeptide (TPR) repeat protein